MHFKMILFMGSLIGFISITEAHAQYSDYDRGYNDGFTAGLNRCEAPRPNAPFEMRCVAEDTGYGYRYQLRLSDRHSETYFIAGIFDREGTYRNHDACLLATDDLRRTGYQYLCIPIAFNGYGTSYGLSKVTKEGASFRLNIFRKFDGTHTETNLRDCRAQLVQL